MSCRCLTTARLRLMIRARPWSREHLSIMTESITVRGFAGTTPELKIANSGTHVTTFRLASTPRWVSSATGEWTSGETNWYTVVAFGPFAENVAESINKGDPVVVLGRPKIRQWENTEKGTTGTEVEISAKSVGHDLKLGRSRFTRVNRNGEDSDRTEDSGQGSAQHDGAAQESSRHSSAGGPITELDGADPNRPHHTPVGAAAWDKTPESAAAPF